MTTTPDLCPTCDGLRTISLAYDGMRPCPDCARPKETPMPEHPEDRCDDCGGRNIKPWWTSSDRWRLAISTYGGTPDRPDRDAILCPACFVDRWSAATGLVATWRLEPDPHTIRDAGHDAWIAEHVHGATDAGEGGTDAEGADRG